MVLKKIKPIYANSLGFLLIYGHRTFYKVLWRFEYFPQSYEATKFRNITCK